MKKMVSILLVVAMMASMLTACGGKTDETKKETTKETQSASEAKASDETEAAGETVAAGDSDTLIMATEAGFAPYEYTEDGSTVIGVDVDIANEIAKAMGKTLEIQNMTFDGALIAVQQGKADFAAAGISVTEERKASMDFTVEYATSKQVIVVNKSADKIKSAEDITADTIVGVQLGNVADSYCSDEMDCQVNQYQKFLEAAQDLKNNKIDCIVMDSLPAEEMVKANDDLKILDGELFTDKYAIAVQKGNTEMLDAINEVLEKLMADGKIEEFTIAHTTK